MGPSSITRLSWSAGITFALPGTGTSLPDSYQHLALFDPIPRLDEQFHYLAVTLAANFVEHLHGFEQQKDVLLPDRLARERPGCRQ